MASSSDLLTALQNAVVAINNLVTQVKGSLNNIAARFPVPNYTGGAWTPYAPIITATAGAFGTVSAAGSFLQIGKLVLYTCTIAITAVGTASGAIVMALPVGTAARNCALQGMEFLVTGKTVSGRLLTGASSATLAYYDNTFPGASGNTVVMTGTYEAA